MEYANGKKYVGDWFEDIMAGQGLYVCVDGRRYEYRHFSLLSNTD